MTSLQLPALSGRNPLGFFAALGTLDALRRVHPEAASALHWSGDGAPTAVITGIDHTDQVIRALNIDRQHWSCCTLLTWAADGQDPLTHLRPPPAETRRWIAAIGASTDTSPHCRAQQRLVAGLVAEGGVDNSGKTKPTSFDFTAGQQRFLTMARQLARNVDEERFTEALFGPWRYDSTLPLFGWDAGSERIYALRGTNPSKEQRTGVPGADWLGFLGLAYFPVHAIGGVLHTTGCTGTWKETTFTWPLWHEPLPPAVIRSLLRDQSLVNADIAQRHRRGVSHLFQAPIRRSEQGGYGSFGAAEAVVAGGIARTESLLLRPPPNRHQSRLAPVDPDLAAITLARPVEF